MRLSLKNNKNIFLAPSPLGSEQEWCWCHLTGSTTTRNLSVRLHDKYSSWGLIEDELQVDAWRLSNRLRLGRPTTPIPNSGSQTLEDVCSREVWKRHLFLEVGLDETRMKIWQSQSRCQTASVMTIEVASAQVLGEIIGDCVLEPSIRSPKR